MLVLHVGANDLGIWSMRHLIRDMKLDFLRLCTTFLYLVVVWSDIIGRTSWRFARSVEKLNKARIKINKEMRRFVMCNGGFVVRHHDLKVDTWRYLQSYGVHLNAIGTDLWILGIQDGIQKALYLWRGLQV